LLPGAVNVTETDVEVATVAVPIVGAPGTVQVVIELDAELAALVPIAFVAVTVNV
jgi:DNA-binding IclR family transcriptional regulator